MFKKIAMWNVNRKRNNDTPADTVQNDNNHVRDSSHDCWFGSARFSLSSLEENSEDLQVKHSLHPNPLAQIPVKVKLDLDK
jgi:hypothetical protein